MLIRRIEDTLEERTRTFLGFLGGITSLAFQTVILTVTPPYKRRRILEQSKKAGLDSFLIVALISFFIGVIFSFQISYLMRQLGAEMYIASIVALSIVRELGPVITALIVAGRVGASITAELGSMQVTEQIDALTTLATNPVKYLVVPRFVALAMMLPILTLFADMIGIVGGWIICVTKLGIPSKMYMTIAFDSLQFKDLFTGLIKTVFFGMIIAFVSCYEGFNVEGGAEGVGKATTQSVVISFILIIACDCFFTALFYFIFP
ncbi:MAG TPA: ABC transporter permease [Candidatus Omnitrophota bacterium]|nr:ABC transporter permease [Candidatus Omnitrophota bacterium]HNQ50541.1 ABC transporter permease [Candidatus Omnitrophota bacterium]HQO37486.1 ABC transporter permease [Candidatus Omnitrophota bacterium]HQQ06880.1 ABC transporter permease [Candidatus Omnitrophota bacterium]